MPNDGFRIAGPSSKCGGGWWVVSLDPKVTAFDTVALRCIYSRQVPLLSFERHSLHNSPEVGRVELRSTSVPLG